MARLLQRSDFLSLYDKGESRNHRGLWVYFQDRGDGDQARCGITITRKAGKAVRRNRVRRRIREIIRLLQPRLRPGMDFVINCSPRTVDLEFHDLQTRVVNLLAAARLLIDDPTDAHSDQT